MKPYALAMTALGFAAGMVAGILVRNEAPPVWPVAASAAESQARAEQEGPAAARKASGRKASDDSQPGVGRKSPPPAKDGKLRIIAFGAHPDDAEFQAGGVAILWAAAGHQVKFVSATNGDLGHYQMGGGPLARRRTAEVQAAARMLGIADTQVLDIHDGELMPTLENRKTIARLIRQWQADVVLTHRPHDYNPDHRNLGQLVQDTAFMVTVPSFCPDTPPVQKNPVYLFFPDPFPRPYPFQPDIAVAIDEVFPKKIDAIDALASQVYETVYGVDEKTRQERLGRIPKDAPGRRRYLEAAWHDRQ